MTNTFPKESQFQKAAMEYLRLVLLPPAFAFHVPNEGKRSKWVGAELKKQGMLPGAPDILIFYPTGKVLGFELKSASGTMTQSQKDFQAMAGQCGVPVTTIRTIDELEQTLSLCSVPTRASKSNSKQKETRNG